MKKKKNINKKQIKNYQKFNSNSELNCSKYIKQSINILSNPIYLSMTFGLCTIYFIVTNIQFWMTAYLIDIIGANPLIVVSVFSFTTITAPLSGIIIGGTFSDSYGGYKGKNTYKAIQMCVAFGLIAFIFAFPLGFLFLLIFLLFFVLMMKNKVLFGE